MAVVERTLIVFLVAALAACGAAEKILCAEASNSNNSTLPETAINITIDTSTQFCLSKLYQYYINGSLTATLYEWTGGHKTVNGRPYKCNEVHTTKTVTSSSYYMLETECTCCTNLCNKDLKCPGSNSAVATNFASPITLLITSTAFIVSKMF